MKIPYIATYMEDISKKSVLCNNDDDFHIKTANVEQSEPDEFLMKKTEGPQTFTVEGTEPDEVSLSERIAIKITDPNGYTFSETIITETIEHIDPDEHILLSENIETRTFERSEPDEIMFSSESEEITKSIEQSQPDEQYFIH